MHKNELPISTPCGVDWNGMTKTEARARLCAHCDKLVHDISAMSEPEARGVLAKGPACVRFLYDADGNVLFGKDAERPVLIRQSQLLRKVSQSRFAKMAALAGALVALEACGGAPTRHAVMMGAVAPELPDPPPEPRDNPIVVEGTDGGVPLAVEPDPDEPRIEEGPATKSTDD